MCREERRVDGKLHDTVFSDIVHVKVARAVEPLREHDEYLAVFLVNTYVVHVIRRIGQRKDLLSGAVQVVAKDRGRTRSRCLMPVERVVPGEEVPELVEYRANPPVDLTSALVDFPNLVAVGRTGSS